MPVSLHRLSFRPLPRSATGLLLLLLVAARGEGCSFSIGPNGLCAALRLDPENKVIRVGETFRVRINASGCTAATGCPCVDSATATARWRSDSPGTASVDSIGVVRGRQPGNVDIHVAPVAGDHWLRTRVHVTVTP
jgi:hypothetical protein